MPRDEKSVEVSAIVPVFNNATTLEELCRRLVDVLGLAASSFEILLVEDGSGDGSWALIQRLAASDPRMRGIRLARNFGQAAALCAGFERMRGEVAVTIDADLQNFPEDVPLLLAEVRTGHDLVSGVRSSREDPTFARKIPSLLANRLGSWVTGIALRDVGCGLNAVTRRLAESIGRSGDMRRFLKPLAASLADSVAEVSVQHVPSPTGRSSYTFMDLLGLQIDLFTSFSRKPFQRVGLLGVLLFLGGFAGGVLHVGLLVVTGSSLGLRAQALLILAMIFGLQLAVLGLLGEFIVRIYHAQSRPFFLVRQETGAGE
jgi:glycosyltransferase involved in cell wall biosynthesis